MNDKQELTFSQVLEDLFGNKQLPIHLIYRLSDLSPEQIDEFKRGWSAVGDDRRVAIARHMADISEESYLVNFDAVSSCLFDDRAAEVRKAALEVIWDSTDTSLLPAIISMLQGDNDQTVRAGAARALAHYILLGEWGEIDPQHTVPVIQVLLSEYEIKSTSVEVKRAILEAVASAPDPRISEFILAAYEDGSFEMQLSALFAMGNTADKQWLPILEQEFENPSPEMRAEAVRAAGSIGDTRSIDAIQSLLNDDDPDVCMAAIQALGQIGGERASQILSELSEHPDYEDLYEVIDVALDEMDWVVGEFDILDIPELDDDDYPDGLRLN